MENKEGVKIVTGVAEDKENDKKDFNPNAGDKMIVNYSVGINGENVYNVYPEYKTETGEGSFTTLDAIKSTAMINFSHLINRVSIKSPIEEIDDGNGGKRKIRKVTTESLDEGIAEYANFVAMRRAIELEWIDNWFKNLVYRGELNIDEPTIDELMKMIKEII